MDETRPLTPEARARAENLQGVPVQLQFDSWTLAYGGLHPDLREIRDTLYDDAVFAAKVEPNDVLDAAANLLRLNYDITVDEAVDLLFYADPKTIVSDVLDAIVGLNPQRRTYTDWAESALYANGLDPATIPAHVLPHVLQQLVQTGRAASPGEYTDSGRAAAERAALPRPEPTP